MKFIFSKATQGTTIVDSTYSQSVAGAASVGIPLGPYHFFDYRLDGIAQADYFVNAVNARGGFAGHLPPVVDVECLLSMGVSNQPYAAAQLKALMGEVYSKTGRMPIIYTSAYEWQLVTGSDRTFGSYPLWAACWGCNSPPNPAGWKKWLYWQQGSIHIRNSGSLDSDVFNGTDAGILPQLTGSIHVINGDAPYATSPTLSINLDGFDGTFVRETLDDLTNPLVPVTWSAWQPRPSGTTAFSFAVSTTDGPKTVSVQLEDPYGNLSPILTDTIMLDTAPPALAAPGPVFRLGPLAAGGATNSVGALVPVTMGWSASDATAGLLSTGLTQGCASTPGVTAGVPLPGTTATSVDLLLSVGDRCQFWIDASDAAGLTAGPLAGPSFAIRKVQEKPTSALKYVGTWKTVSGSGFDGGTDRYATKKGATATYRFTGTDVALVSSMAPDRGRAQILIDGKAVATLNLFAAARTQDAIVFQRHFTASGTHTITVKALGTHVAGSRGNRVDVDAFLTLTR